MIVQFFKKTKRRFVSTDAYVKMSSFKRKYEIAYVDPLGVEIQTLLENVPANPFGMYDEKYGDEIIAWEAYSTSDMDDDTISRLSCIFSVDLNKIDVLVFHSDFTLW